MSCNTKKSLTSFTPLQFTDFRVLDVALHLWLDGMTTTVGDIICRNRVAIYFRMFRKAASSYISTKILPYLTLPGPVEVDETKIGA